MTSRKAATALPVASPKETAPDDSEEQKQRLAKALGEEDRVLAQSFQKQQQQRNAAAVCVWKGTHGEVATPRGKHLVTAGSRTKGGTARLHPEEVVFLSELGAIAVVVDGAPPQSSLASQPLSVANVWRLCLDAGMSVAHYTAFSYLRRLGFVVLRHGTVDVAQLLTGANKQKKKKKEKKTTNETAAAASADVVEAEGSEQTRRCRGWWPKMDAPSAVLPVPSNSLRPLSLLPTVTATGTADGDGADGGGADGPARATNRPRLNEMVHYDVWLPGCGDGFRKLVPDFYLAVFGRDDQPPDPTVLRELMIECSPVQLRMAVAWDGDVTFFTVGALSL